MADQRILYTEEMVGANHPTKADTLNRLALVEHNTDGTHKSTVIAAAQFKVLPGCRVRHSAAQSIPDATNTILAFDTEDDDGDTMHDPSTNNSRITIKTSGTYIFGCNIAWAANSTGYRQVQILLNGTSAIASSVLVPPGATAGPHHVIAMRRAFNANDYIEVRVYQNSGGALNVVTGGTVYSPVFWAHFVGAK